MEELKPCPFCGGKAKLKMGHDNEGWTIWCACSKCYAKAPRYCPNMENDEENLESIDRCKNLALNAWNRRMENEENTF